MKGDQVLLYDRSSWTLSVIRRPGITYTLVKGRRDSMQCQFTIRKMKTGVLDVSVSSELAELMEECAADFAASGGGFAVFDDDGDLAER